MDPQLASWLTALATVALVLVTLVLAGVTAWYLKQQNDRAKIAHNTELFMRLREHALSPQHVDRRRRMIALLMHLEGRGISTDKLEFSPDIALYLNDYEWIGRFVQEGIISEQYAMATYGRNLLLLYPKLEPYIKKQQERRKYNDLWKEVSDLYEKLKQLDKHPLTESEIDEIRKLEMGPWLRPSTVLITNEDRREVLDVDRLLQDVAAQEGVVLHHYFDGKKSQRYRVDYFHFPGAPRDEARNNLALPQLADIALKLGPFIQKIWLQYDDPTVARTVAKFDKFARFALAYTRNGELVAFNIYKVGLVETKAGPAKTIYVEHAGTHPDHQQNGVTYAIRKEFYRRENPDIICGSSANQAIYKVNKDIAEDRGMAIYPRPDDTDPSQLYVPEAIQELAVQIVETLGITGAALDPTRLVRTYDSPVAPTPVPHELQGLLQLNNTQHVFYILVSSRLNEALLETKK
jgi:hypothetical protein